MEHAVTEPFRFRDRERTIETEGLRPCDQVLGGEYELEPCVVADDIDAWEVAEASVFRGADPVLDMRAVTVGQLEGR